MKNKISKRKIEASDDVKRQTQIGATDISRNSASDSKISFRAESKELQDALLALAGKLEYTLLNNNDSSVLRSLTSEKKLASGEETETSHQLEESLENYYSDGEIPPLHSAPNPRVQEVSERIAARLASELEVMIQSHLEEAVTLVTREIQHAYAKHLAIVLPEIIEDLFKEDIT